MHGQYRAQFEGATAVLKTVFSFERKKT